MTQEEKAKAYDEALSRAEALYDNESSSADTLITCEAIFPELAESEDERIRKALIRFHKSTIDLDGIKGSEIISWLEKQGYHKEYTFKSIPRLLEMIEPTNRAKFYCKKLIESLQTEGYSTDAKIVSDCLKQMKGEKVAMATMDEQKSDCNEEDERIRKALIDFFSKGAEYGAQTNGVCDKDILAWLKKQGTKQPLPVSNEHAWLYFVSDVLTWKDGIGQYLDDPRVQELAKKLSSEYSQKLYK